MKKNLFFLFLILGWILFGILLLSGAMFNSLTNDSEANFFTPVSWDNHLQIFSGVIQCNLTSEALLERKAFLKKEIFSKVIDKKEVEDGFVYYFNDQANLLNLVFEFTQKEKECCPFFKFDISILPFERGFALKISGSPKVFEFLKDFESNEF